MKAQSFDIFSNMVISYDVDPPTNVVHYVSFVQSKNISFSKRFSICDDEGMVNVNYVKYCIKMFDYPAMVFWILFLGCLPKRR